MNDAKQKAQEIADKLCAIPEMNSKHWQAITKRNAVLKELNLESLIEDSLLLDWMDKHRSHHVWQAFKYHPSCAAMKHDWRTAIRTAMQQEQEKS